MTHFPLTRTFDEVMQALAALYTEEHAFRTLVVDSVDWLEPLFNERLDLRDGRMLVPSRPGLGLTLSEAAGRWTAESAEVGARP